MPGGDAITIEPGKAPGEQVSRYMLKGYTSASCPSEKKGDPTLVIDYSSMKKIISTGDTTLDYNNAKDYPALVTLRQIGGRDTVDSGHVAIVASFTRHLSGATGTTTTGSVDIISDEDIYITAGWGPKGALTMGTHTSAMSGAIYLNLQSGEILSLNNTAPLWIIILHAAFALAGVAICLPLSLYASTCGRYMTILKLGNYAANSPLAWWRRANKHAIHAATLFNMIGFIVGLIMASKSWTIDGEVDETVTTSRSHFTSLHGQLGLIFFILNLFIFISTFDVVHRQIYILMGKSSTTNQPPQPKLAHPTTNIVTVDIPSKIDVKPSNPIAVQNPLSSMHNNGLTNNSTKEENKTKVNILLNLGIGTMFIFMFGAIVTATGLIEVKATSFPIAVVIIVYLAIIAQGIGQSWFVYQYGGKNIDTNTSNGKSIETIMVSPTLKTKTKSKVSNIFAAPTNPSSSNQ